MSLQAHLIQVFMSLFAIINPFASLGLFLHLTRSYTPREKRITAVQTTITCGIFLLITTWIGSYIINVLGIIVYNFQIAGGIILTGLGLNLVKGIQKVSTDDIKTEKRRSIAIVPMAIPAMVGPATMAAVIIHEQSFPGAIGQLEISGICLLQTLIVGMVLLGGSTLENFLGKQGIDVITKIMGLVLTAIAIQMVTSGILGIMPRLG